MKIIKITDIPEVKYQIRHWGKWYWVFDTGQIFRIDKAIKTAEVLKDE